MITLSCEEVRREISNYLDDDMSPSMRRLLETHLEQCRKCAVLLDSTHNVLVLLADEQKRSAGNECWSASVRQDARGESSFTSKRAGTPASAAGQRHSGYPSGAFLRSIDGTGVEHLQHSNCNFEPTGSGSSRWSPPRVRLTALSGQPLKSPNCQHRKYDRLRHMYPKPIVCSTSQDQPSRSIIRPHQSEKCQVADDVGQNSRKRRVGEIRRRTKRDARKKVHQ
jgi:hypothetical protein